MCHLHLLSAGAGAPQAEPPAPGCCPGRAPAAQAMLQRRQGLGRTGCVLGTQAQGLRAGSSTISWSKEPTVSPCGFAACPVPLPQNGHCHITPAPTFVGDGLH